VSSLSMVGTTGDTDSSVTIVDDAISAVIRERREKDRRHAQVRVHSCESFLYPRTSHDENRYTYDMIQVNIKAIIGDIHVLVVSLQGETNVSWKRFIQEE
jgi:hypothetical protein